MSDLVFDTFNGLVFGDDGETTGYYPLIESPGSSDLSLSATLLDGSAGDGASLTPQWADRRQWTTVIEVRDETASGFDTKRDALLAATSVTANRFAELPYIFNTRDRALTSFCRVVRRSVPRDEGSEVWFMTEASIGFAALDPILYGAPETLTFEGSSDTNVVATDGWVPSWRWTWTVPGPVTNPTLSSDAADGLVVRYVGEVPDGSTLVVVMYPQKVQAITTKIVDDADVSDAETFGTGEWCYADMDGGAGSNRPPQWFPVADGVTITYTASAGTGGCTLVYRPGFD